MPLIFDIYHLQDSDIVSLPEHFLRLQHGRSGNRSIYHPHRDDRYHPPDTPSLDPQHAVRSYAQLEPESLLGNSTRRHLLHFCKNPPHSPFISALDCETTTEGRVPFWIARYSAKLIVILKIETEGMTPALCRIQGQPDLLVWVSESARPKNGQPITWQPFRRLRPKPELFISMRQAHKDKVWGPRWWRQTSYQPVEWLMSAFLPRSRVVEVRPCLGTLVIKPQEHGRVPIKEFFGREFEWCYDNNVFKTSRKRQIAEHWISSEDEDALDAHASDPSEGMDDTQQPLRKKARYDTSSQETLNSPTSTSEELGEKAVSDGSNDAAFVSSDESEHEIEMGKPEDEEPEEYSEADFGEDSEHHSSEQPDDVSEDDESTME